MTPKSTKMLPLQVTFKKLDEQQHRSLCILRQSGLKLRNGVAETNKRLSQLITKQKVNSPQINSKSMTMTPNQMPHLSSFHPASNTNINKNSNSSSGGMQNQMNGSYHSHVTAFNIQEMSNIYKSNNLIKDSIIQTIQENKINIQSKQNDSQK